MRMAFEPTVLPHKEVPETVPGCFVSFPGQLLLCNQED